MTGGAPNFCREYPASSIRGVVPSSAATDGFAPFATSNSTIAKSPAVAARSSGVAPFGTSISPATVRSGMPFAYGRLDFTP